MRALVVMLLLGTACASKALEKCEAGKALSPPEHLQRCAGLIKAPTCRQYVLDLDGGALEAWAFGERCRHEYCGRFTKPVPFCTGENGTPATAYRPEFDFMAAVLELDEGTAARAAFFEAASRDAEARFAVFDEERRLRQREARLILKLEGDRERLELTVLRPGGVTGFSGPTADFDPERCRAVITRALDGGALGGKPVLIRASKKVMFRSIRCLTAAATDAGAGPDDLDIATLPAE
ncbi:MAG: hypothetical protein ABTQ32_12250 [Myxococcaceae bacterium]